MRKLTVDEVQLVAGGWDSSCEYDFYDPNGAGSGGGGGGGGSQDPASDVAKVASFFETIFSSQSVGVLDPLFDARYSDTGGVSFGGGQESGNGRGGLDFDTIFSINVNSGWGNYSDPSQDVIQALQTAGVQYQITSTGSIYVPGMGYATANTGDDIVITAQRNNDNTLSLAVNLMGSAGGANSGSGGGQIQVGTPEFEILRDATIDSVADKLLKTIQAKPDLATNEYFGFVFRDNLGMLKTSPLIVGTNGNTNLTQFPPSYYGMDSWAQVVATVHSQPSMFRYVDTNGQVQTAPRGPEANIPSVGDFQNAKFYTDNGANASDMRLYILTPSAGIKEYSYSANTGFASSGASSDSSANGAVEGTFRPGGAP